MIVLVLAMAGCMDYAPAYQISVLNSDAKLVGSWTLEITGSQNEDGTQKKLPMEISSKPMPAKGGRLGRFGERAATGANETQTVQGYLIDVKVPEEEDKGKKFGPLTYDAVLLNIDGATLVAYQPTEDRFSAMGAIDFLPVHRILRLEREGETYRLSTMKSPIVWVPTLKPLNGESDVVALPAGEEGASYVVVNPDRLVRVLGLALKNPEEWQSLAVLRPVAAKP